MTLYHEIEAECERLADCSDTPENAKLGITFRAVWWRQIRQEIAKQAAEIERLKAIIRKLEAEIEELKQQIPAPAPETN